MICCHLIVSEWLLFNTKWVIFQPYQGENKLHFDEMMSGFRFTLDKHS
jgi:hypothetical protein